jgi:class 3 adenylate cyclase
MSRTRRLAAILAADVAGYSRLMGADEEGTHERLKAHFRELIEPKIREHRGRTVKNTGDGFLVEFASVVACTGPPTIMSSCPAPSETARRDRSKHSHHR